MDWLPSGSSHRSFKNTIQSVTTQETVLLWTGLRFGAVKFDKSDCERGKDSKGAQDTDSSASENLANEMRKLQMPRSRAIDIILNIEENTRD